jgi:hypothetical protein
MKKISCLLTLLLILAPIAQALDLGHEAVWMLQLTIEQLNPVAGKAPSEATGYLPNP